MTDAPETAAAAAPVANRLRIDEHGHLVGDAWITRNDPFPCVNGQFGLTPPMNGAVLHTNVGGLPGTIATFSNPAKQASAHFEIGGHWSGSEKNGQVRIHQFGPVNGWEAWHCADGNSMWFGIETEDGGDPANPLTSTQLTACAQVLEALSAHGDWGFPLQVTDNTNGKGLGAHYMGGLAWSPNGHTCPDPSPAGGGPRSHQRGEIVRRAKILRQHGQYPAPAPHPAPKTTPLLEDTMILLNQGEGAITPIAIPNGAKRLRFASNSEATLHADFGPDHGGSRAIEVAYMAASGVAIPDGAIEAVVHRIDGGLNQVACTVTE